MPNKESNFFQDVVPDPGSAKSAMLSDKKEIPGFLKRKLSAGGVAPDRPRRSFKNPLIIGVGFIGVVLLVFLGGLFFKKATAEITPKKIEAEINTNFFAERGAPLADRLTFQTRDFNVKVQRALNVVGSRTVERKS